VLENRSFLFGKKEEDSTPSIPSGKYQSKNKNLFEKHKK
jgi:hypothetical protein